MEEVEHAIVTAIRLARRRVQSCQEDCEPVEIVPHVFVGALGCVAKEETLRRHGITHVISVLTAPAVRVPSDVRHLKIRVEDRPAVQIKEYFGICIDFINEALHPSSTDSDESGANVLVHCVMGQSRSVTVVLAYLISTQEYTLESALALVRRKRPSANPNVGFMVQLRTFERTYLHLCQVIR